MACPYATVILAGVSKTRQVFVFGGTDRKNFFADLYRFNFDVGMTWKMVEPFASTEITNGPDVKHLYLRCGHGLISMAPTQEQSQKNIKPQLLCYGGDSLEQNCSVAGQLFHEENEETKNGGPNGGPGAPRGRGNTDAKPNLGKNQTAVIFAGRQYSRDNMEVEYVFPHTKPHMPQLPSPTNPQGDGDVMDKSREARCGFTLTEVPPRTSKNNENGFALYFGGGSGEQDGRSMYNDLWKLEWDIKGNRKTVLKWSLAGKPSVKPSERVGHAATLVRGSDNNTYLCVCGK